VANALRKHNHHPRLTLLSNDPPAAIPRQVDFFDKKDDHACALYASMGFSTRFICEQTGLTKCQVTYRIQKAGLTIKNGTSRMDFRNGKSPFAMTFLASMKENDIADRQLTKYLKAHA
jgi:hypothetical protein